MRAKSVVVAQESGYGPSGLKRVQREIMGAPMVTLMFGGRLMVAKGSTWILFVCRYVLSVGRDD